MKFLDCPSTLREGVLGLTLFQIFNDHNRETDFISLENVESVFKQYTGQNIKDVFEPMNTTIFDFVDRFFADFVNSIGLDRLLGFKIIKPLSKNVYEKFWDIGSVKDESSTTFGLDVIPMASVVSTNVAGTEKVSSFDNLASLGASLTTFLNKNESSATIDSASSKLETSKSKKLAAAKKEPASAKIESATSKIKPGATVKKPALEEVNPETKSYFGLESLDGILPAASSSNVSDATSSESATRETTPVNDSKEILTGSQPSIPNPPPASKPSKRQLSGTSSVLSTDDSAMKASKKVKNNTKTTEPPHKDVPPKPHATVTPLQLRPVMLTDSELKSLIETSFISLVSQEQMKEINKVKMFSNVVATAHNCESVPPTWSTSISPANVASEPVPCVRFIVNRDYVITNFDVAVTSRKAIAQSVQRFPLNVTIGRWVEEFLNFADIILCLQYMNHFFKLFEEPILTSSYHLFVKTVADREPIFLDVAPLIGCLDVMLAWDFLRLKINQNGEPDFITLNPLITKLTMIPLSIGMPSILFFALTEQKPSLVISDFCSQICLPFNETVDLVLDTINKRPDLYVLSAPAQQKLNSINFTNCIVELNPRVVPLCALYNYKLNDLSFFEELKLRKDDVDSVSQFE